MGLGVKPLVAAVVWFGSIAQGLSQNSTRKTVDEYHQDLPISAKSSLMHYRSAELFLRQRNYQAATNEFRASLAGDRQPQWTTVWSHLSLAWIFSLTGEHERAVSEYAQAEQTGEIGAEVAKYLRSIDPADDLPLPPGTYRVGDDVIAPAPIEQRAPEYSAEARLAGLEGEVLLAGVITEEGVALELRVNRSLGLGLDEQAIAAVKEWRFRPGMYQGRPVPVLLSIPVDFRLSDKQSRWHLVQATFQVPEGASRPAFLRAPYPIGAGVSARSIEQARIVAAVGRLATATVSFEVDQHGIPAHFQVKQASGEFWGNEAIALLRQWRFVPGTKDDVSIAVSCTLGLVWGRRTLPAATQSRWSTVSVAPTPPRQPQEFSPPDAGVHRVLVNGHRQASQLRTQVTPHYPLLAQQARVQGVVHYDALIGTEGRVKELHVISGDSLLVPTATDAVKQWIYRQTMLDGTPAEVVTQIDVYFTLPEGPSRSPNRRFQDQP